MDVKEKLKIPRQKMPEQDPRVRAKNFLEVPLGYTPKQAQFEAQRCLKCKIPILILWLVGGGFAPIFMSILASLTATRINNPLEWWRAHLPVNLLSFLSELWPWSIIAFVLAFSIGVEIAIFGYPLLWLFDANVTYTIQWTLALIMVVLWPVSIITAFARDIQKKKDYHKVPPM